MDLENKTKYLNEKQVAGLTGMAVQTLRNWRHRGTGPSYVKLNTTVRYSWQDVCAYMEGNKVITEGR